MASLHNHHNSTYKATQTAVSTALPTIVASIPDFPANQFVWIGSAYALASAAFMPVSGSLVQIFGRRPIMIFCLVVFGAGSAMCGAAKTASLLIAGRTIQGMGGGGLISLANIVLADLVPLRERGSFNGLIGLYVFFQIIKYDRHTD